MKYKDKEVDEKYIEKAITYILDKEKELSPYVKNITIEKRKNSIGYYGMYDNQKKEIVLNLEYIKDLKVNELYNKQALKTLQIIRHEIEHARNLKTLYDYKDTLERLLIEYSLINYCADHQILMHGFFVENKDERLYTARKIMNYKLDPGERIADIKSWKYIVNMLKNQRNSEELLKSRECLYNTYCNGYKNNNYYIEPPTYNYLLNMQQLSDYYYLKKRLENKKYNVNNRLLGGLPLRNTEFDSEIAKITKNNKVLKR